MWENELNDSRGQFPSACELVLEMGDHDLVQLVAETLRFKCFSVNPMDQSLAQAVIQLIDLAVIFDISFDFFSEFRITGMRRRGFPAST